MRRSLIQLDLDPGHDLPHELRARLVRHARILRAVDAQYRHRRLLRQPLELAPETRLGDDVHAALDGQRIGLPDDVLVPLQGLSRELRRVGLAHQCAGEGRVGEVSTRGAEAVADRGPDGVRGRVRVVCALGGAGE